MLRLQCRYLPPARITFFVHSSVLISARLQTVDPAPCLEIPRAFWACAPCVSEVDGQRQRKVLLALCIGTAAAFAPGACPGASLSSCLCSQRPCTALIGPLVDPDMCRGRVQGLRPTNKLQRSNAMPQRSASKTTSVKMVFGGLFGGGKPAVGDITQVGRRVCIRDCAGPCVNTCTSEYL